MIHRLLDRLSKRFSAPLSLSEIVYQINVRLYEDAPFAKIRANYDRTGGDPDDPVSNAKREELRHLTAKPNDIEAALKSYLCDLAREIVSTNHHLPGYLKYVVLQKLGQECGYETFVETGTLYADGCLFLRDVFKIIYTIDIDPWCFERAKLLSGKYPVIHPLLGDSGKILDQVLAKIDTPALFFLDGHLTRIGGGQPYGTMQSAEFGSTPVVEELSQIARHGVKTHAIVIDDASCFENAAPGYPSLDETRALCGRLFPGHRFSVLYGMIFVVPQSVDFALLGHKV